MDDTEHGPDAVKVLCPICRAAIRLRNGLIVEHGRCGAGGLEISRARTLAGTTVAAPRRIQ